MGAVKARALLRDPLWIAAVALYILNRWLLKPHLPWDFLQFHFNDCLLIPAALPPVLALQQALGLRPHSGPPAPGEVLFHLIVWSVLFEAVGPRLLPVAGDPWDVACYVSGAAVASVFWFLQANSGFDRLAPFYPWLETLFCGNSLQRARACHLPELKTCREILVVGEGTGCFLAAALGACPQARFTCVDASSAMLERTVRKLECRPADANRVRLLRLCLPEMPRDPICYDAIVTPFFLDCFEGSALAEVVAALAGRARGGTLWLAADYAPPVPGWRGMRSRFWLGLLYFFFRLTARIQARHLEDPAPLIEAHGFTLQKDTPLAAGLLHARCWTRGFSASNGPPPA